MNLQNVPDNELRCGEILRFYVAPLYHSRFNNDLEIVSY